MTKKSDAIKAAEKACVAMRHFLVLNEVYIVYVYVETKATSYNTIARPASVCKINNFLQQTTYAPAAALNLCVIFF